MEEAQIKQIIERQPLHGSALLDPRCKILLLVCIGFVSYFLAGQLGTVFQDPRSQFFMTDTTRELAFG